mgnify:CR=1 FL=1|jgi:hypothetical protein
MAYDAKTERLIALKKLAGKAQTSNDKGLANEGLPSGITSTSETIFGETITTAPSSTSLYTITGKVEYVRFSSTFIAGTDTTDGRHGFELKLPADYETNSSNSKKGTYPFINSQTINITSGALQLIPPSFATAYEAKPYYGGSATKDSGTQIPLLDARDWYLDYFNGVFFQQDPTGTGDQSDNPDYVEGYLYIGKMLDTVVSTASSGNGDKSPQYLVLAATGSLPNERVFTAGTGIKSTDSGAGAAYTVAVKDSVVATLTGSIFSGIVSAPALTGSLTKLQDGTAYLRAGSNITITSGSGGFITIASTGTPGSGDSDKRAAYLVLSATGSLENERVFTEGTGIKTTDSGAGGAYTIAIRDSIVATLTGSQFSGNIGVTGSLGVESGAVFRSGLSGSLQLLSDGTSYLRAGSNVTITSGSAGSVTIASTGGGESRSKQSYFLSSNFIPGAPIAVGSSDFSAASYNPQKIDVYLNGQLVHSGSVSEVTAGSRDYYISSATSLKFSFRVVIHDVLDVIVFTAS